VGVADVFLQEYLPNNCRKIDAWWSNRFTNTTDSVTDTAAAAAASFEPSVQMQLNPSKADNY
jgi:hypothetical protein